MKSDKELFGLAQMYVTLEKEYEKAAVIRDQIASIEEIMEKQFVDLVDDDLDQDVIAIAPGDDEVVVIIMPVRNGKIVGRDDFLMSASQYDSPSEIMFSPTNQLPSIKHPKISAYPS